MADISIIQDEYVDEADEGVFEQGDCNSGGSTDDESLPPLVRIQKYAQSPNAYDRQIVSRITREVFRSASADVLTADLPKIMDLITRISEEDESMVRTDLLDQIPLMAAQAADNSIRVPALKNIVGDYLLPLVVRNLGCSDNAVDKAAQNTLLHLLEQGLVSNLQAEIQVCPTILALSQVENASDCNTGIITLMSKMAPLVGKDITERIFLRRFAQLCGSNVFYVRKICASHFGDFCAVVGMDAYETVLLPHFVELCTDDVWGVRKSCAEVVMFVSWGCTPSVRRTTLAPVFGKLLQDECKWVKMSAFQTLGPFITTFANPTVTNVTYNNSGELVMVNQEGNEYLMNVTTIFDGVIPFCPKFSNDVWDIFDICNGEDEDNTTQEVEEKSQNDSICEYIKKYVNEDNTPKPDEEAENQKTCNSNVIHNNPDTKEQCDTLDNVVDDLSESINRINIVQEGGDCNSNLQCTSLNGNGVASAANQVNSTTLHPPAEDDIYLYNSYNYWYVSPELPLDPSIIDGGRASDSQCVNVVDNRQVVIENLDLSGENGSGDSPKDTSDLNGTFTVDSPEVKPKKPDQDVVPQLLVDHFISMTDPTLISTIDSEITYYCAYSLPAVALTLGSKNWHLLKETVECLAGDMQYKVRRTVASSLHELALILGPEVATTHLTPIFEGFLKDLDEVKIGILKHLAHFLKLISPIKRSLYLPRLQEFLYTDNQCNWRFRRELATQLLEAVPLFKPADTARCMSHMAQELLCDNVSAVRQEAIILICAVIKYISSEPGLTPLLLVKLAEKFAHSKKWKRRQTFALLSCELLATKALSNEQFDSEIMPHLLDLSWDPVANVRLVVARTIVRHIVTNQYYMDPINQHDGLETVLRRLQADKDTDVRLSATPK